MKVIVGVPMERTIPEAAVWGLIGIAQQGYPFIRQGYTRTDVARNQFAEHLLSTDCTHLLMLDLDHDHPMDIVTRLGRWADDEHQVIAGLAFRRGPPHDPLMFYQDEAGQWYAPTEWPQGLVSAGIVGTGAILIDRRVFERLPRPWFAYSYDKPEAWPGEDIWFCRLCREAGVTLWCDTTTVSPHMGTQWIDEAAFRTYLKEHEHGSAST